MRKYLTSKTSDCFLGMVLTLLALQPSLSRAQDNVTLAIFQFRPESIEAMGYESDVMLAVRNEIGNRDALRLIPKRDMEDVLSRKDIDQSYSIVNAIQAGQLLSVRFVLIGTVRKEGAQIEAEMKLVDVNSGLEVGVWQTSYRSRNEIDKAAAKLVEEIVIVATQPMEETATGVKEEVPTPYIPAPQRVSVEPLSAVVAEAKHGRIELRWSPLEGRESLGYNIYRSGNREGPFQFLDTAEGINYTDSSALPNTPYFYRVGEVDMDGQEHRSEMIARGMMIGEVVQASQSVPIARVEKPADFGLNISNKESAAAPDRNEPTVNSSTPDYQLEPILDRTPSGSSDILDYQLEPVFEKEPLTSIVVEARSVELEVKWRTEALTGAREYRVYRATAPDGSYSPIGNATGYNFVDSTIEPGLAYYYRVGVLDESGVETRSELTARGQLPAAVGRADSGDQNVPEPIGSRNLAGEVTPAISLVATPQVTQNSDQVLSTADTNVGLPHPAELIAADQNLLRQAKLIWGPSTSGSGYRIYRRGPDSGWVQIAEIRGLVNTIYTDTHGLQDDSMYSYSYSILDGDAESSRSEPVEISTKAPLPAPTGLKAESGLLGQVRLQWEQVMDPDTKGYAVYRADCSEERNFDVVQIGETDGPMETSWVDLGVPPNTIETGSCYRYAVETLFAPGGVGPLTPAVRVHTQAR